MDTKKLRQKILDLAIHGKLVSQDPNDEPASVLLERIKAEKKRLIKEGKIKNSKKSAKTSDTPHYTQLPVGWCTTTLKDLCENINGLWKGKKEPFVHVGVIRNANFTKDFKLDYSNIEYIDVEQRTFAKRHLMNGDLIVEKWFMAATGARVSELLHIKAEHVKVGYLDLYSKGGKIRRLYIPKNLRTEAEKWLKNQGLTSGYIFLNRFGQRITTRGIASQLKHFAEKYGINKDVVYPHSFRHRFAKNFLDCFHDLALLADLMGHESMETTRIYLRRTASEQQKIVDKVVNW